MSDNARGEGRGGRGQVIALPAPRDAVTEEPARDALDGLIGEAARGLEAPGAGGLHLDAAALLAHLQRRLDAAGRADVIAHLARCALCCDRLEAAMDTLQVARLPTIGGALAAGAASAPAGGGLLDLGRALMRLRVAVEPGSLRVLSAGDAEIRVGLAAPMRRDAASAGGVAFERQLDVGRLQLAMLGARGGGLHLSLALEGAPAGARASLIIAGQLSASEPFMGGQVLLKNLPVRPAVVRIEARGRALGHVHLDLVHSEEEGL